MRRGSGLLRCALVLSAMPLCAGSVASAQKAAAVTSAGAAHSMTSEQARQARPVRFRAEVSYYDPQSNSLFVQDATGGIYVKVPLVPWLPVKAGTLVEVTGVTNPGDFAPIVQEGHLRVLNESHVAIRAPEVKVSEIATGAFDSRLVSVEGLVRSTSRAGHMVSLRIATRDGPIAGLLDVQPGVDYDRLIDATVRVRGVAGVEYNKRRQMTGSHLFISSMADVRVLRLPKGDAYALPVRTLDQLAQFDLHSRLSDRMHIRGRVTLQWPGRLLCVQDATGGICVQTSISDPYPVGTRIDLVGYPLFAAAIPALMDPMVRPSDAETAPLLMERPVSAQEALSGDESGQLVRVEGELVGLSSDGKVLHLTIRSDQTVFDAMLAADDGGAALRDKWRIGSYVRVVGVCENQVDARVGEDWTSAQKIASFRLMMRSAADVAVVRTPSWWTPAHTILAMGCAMLVTLAVFGWVMLLRRQVEQRTQELKESERRFRHLAHHDSLTGVPNRAWFQERAERAIESSRRSGDCIGLLLLDLDNFKPVNDTLGHDAGDAMLCALAQRVTGAVRKVDTVARLGGDEFAVVLVGVTSGEHAERVAHKILKAVCRPVEIKSTHVMMSASIGVAVFPGDGDTVTELLRSADLAMYESKKVLRGGVRRYRREVAIDEVEGLTVVVGLG